MNQNIIHHPIAIYYEQKQIVYMNKLTIRYLHAKRLNSMFCYCSDPGDYKKPAFGYFVDEGKQEDDEEM